ncbi:MAG: GAF domain-containing protein, partial [Caldimonas sp.]
MTVRQRSPDALASTREAAFCKRLVANAAALCAARRVLIVLGGPGDRRIAAARLPRREKAAALLQAIGPWLDEARRTGKARLRHGPSGVAARDQRSCVVAPLVSGRERLGFLYADIDGRQGRFSATDRDRLAGLAAEAASALADARASDALVLEVEQRDAELAVINSIQQGMSAELNLRGIVDLVGDKLREVFDTGDIAVWWWDGPARTGHPYYVFEHGVRQSHGPIHIKPGLVYDRFLVDREVLVTNTRSEMERLGFRVVEGTDASRSAVFVPIVGGDRVLGAVILENHEREHAFGEADVRLLTTVTAAMGTALENARLFDQTQRLLRETEQRNAELAVINSIQRGMTEVLNFQAIVDMVGDKLREVLHAESIGIHWHEAEANLLHHLYMVERGIREYPPSSPPSPQGAWVQMNRTRQAVIARDQSEMVAQNLIAAPNPDICLSLMGVPFFGGDRILGFIHVHDHVREAAFGDSEVRLLGTIAASMGVALENARLFAETQRLLKETEQRNAELAVINSIQQGLVAQLDLPTIIDLVGDRLREVFATGDLSITWFDEANFVATPVYFYEHGNRLPDVAPFQIKRSAANLCMLETRTGVAVNSGTVPGNHPVPGTEMPISYMRAPVVAAGRVIAVVNLDNFERENAFSDDDVRLLTTVCTSMGMALQSAQLFDETQRLLKETEQRNAELAVITSIQQAVSAELDFQGIVDVVGDKLREVFDTGDLSIWWQDEPGGATRSLYSYEHGVRDAPTSFTPRPGAPADRLLRERKTLLMRSQAEQLAIGFPVMEGTDRARSIVAVPMTAGERTWGAVFLENHERDDAFDADQVRLVETITASMTVALLNARSFEAERQRAAELSVINSIQLGMAGSLDFQGIVDMVGDKLRDVLVSNDVHISWLDHGAHALRHLYGLEHGVRLAPTEEAIESDDRWQKILARRDPLVVNNAAQAAAVPTSLIPGTDLSLSAALVPIVTGDRRLGSIQVESFDRENAFGESEIRLLQTVASSMGVALENARLFDETQRLLKETEQRNAELAVINSIQQGLVAELDWQSIVDLVGDRLREVLHYDDLGIRFYDLDTGMMHFPYEYELGQRLTLKSMHMDYGPWSDCLLKDRQPLVMQTPQQLADMGFFASPGTAEAKGSALVPFSMGEHRVGAIAIDARDREWAFDEPTISLLQTIGASMGVALQNARLFGETQRLLKETEQRAAELDTVNRVSQRLSGKLDLDALIELVGEQVRTVFKADMAYVALLDRATGMIDFPYRYGEEQASIAYGEGLTSKIIETGEALILDSDIGRRSQQLGASVLGRQARSYLGVPIVVEGVSQGVISVQNAEREDAFDANDQRLLETIAANVGVALRNARLFNETQEARAAAEAAN